MVVASGCERLRTQGTAHVSGPSVIAGEYRDILHQDWFCTNEYTQYKGIPMEFVFQIQTEKHNHGRSALECI